MITKLLMQEKSSWARLNRGVGIDLERDFLQDQAYAQRDEQVYPVIGRLLTPVNAMITHQIRGPIALCLREERDSGLSD